jgi:hypothetical protein
MKTIRAIVALLVIAAFSGRAVAQSTFFAIDETQNTQLKLSDPAADKDSEADCCCDEDDLAKSDCCGDECNELFCPAQYDPVAPNHQLEPINPFVSPLTLHFKVSTIRGDAWRLGLERPPRFT